MQFFKTFITAAATAFVGGIILLALATATSAAETTADAQLVIDAGRAIQVRSIMTGEQDATLQRYAQEHAERQARQCRQGHQEWGRRFHELRRLVPECHTFSEIAAESWPWQTREQAGPEMFTSWRQSPGHWRTANSPCAKWGYAMAKGRNGIWYGCGIVGYGRKANQGWGQKPLTPSEYQKLIDELQKAPYWIDAQGNKRTDERPPPKAGNLISQAYVDGYWAFRKGIPRNKNPFPWPKPGNSTLAPEDEKSLREAAKQEGWSQEDLDYWIRHHSNASRWDNGWLRGQGDERFRPKQRAEKETRDWHYAVIRYNDPPRWVWLGPWLRYGVAANVVAAHAKQGRTGKVVTRSR